MKNKSFSFVNNIKKYYVVIAAFSIIIGGFFVFASHAPVFAANPGDIVINEFSSNSVPEWVELRNTTASPINLGGWKLTQLTTPQGTPAEVDLLLLTSSSTIPAGGVLAFNVGTNKLNDPGDSIGLFEGTNEIHRVTYGTVTGKTSDVGAPNSGEFAFRDSAAWHIVNFHTKGSINPDVKIGSTYYQSIQAAINVASSGATINVAAGTYTEQLTIGKSLSLVGVNASSAIIQAPNSLTGNKSIVSINGSSTSVAISGFTTKGPVSGLGSGITIQQGANANIHDNHIIDINDNPLSGAQHGWGILVGASAFRVNSYQPYFPASASSGTATITNNTISGYQKNGIIVSNAGSGATITGNTISGAGPTASIAQNSIVIEDGATATITNNQISGNVWTGAYGGTNDPTSDAHADGATGVLLYAPGPSVEVANNTLTANQFGVWTVAAPSVNIHDNTITGLSHTGNAFPTGIAVWSSDGGSEQATGGTINNNVISGNDYGLLVRRFAIASVIEPTVAAHGNAIKNNSVFNAWTNNSTSTKLDAVNNWWGSDNPDPALIVGNVSSAPWWKTPTADPDGVGMFWGPKQAITLTALSGTSIYYTTDGSGPSCGSSNLYSGPITIAPTINAISCSGKASTGVATYKYAISYLTGGGSAGGGGGGNNGGFVPGPVSIPTPAPAPVPTPAPVVAPTITPPVTPQILGVATFNFTNNLNVGTRGNDVTELQKRLTNEGVYAGPITGYFGPLTKAGVIQYQKKYSLPENGIVDNLTLNKLGENLTTPVIAPTSVLTPAAQEAIKVQISSLQAKLVDLLQQLLQILHGQKQ